MSSVQCLRQFVTERLTAAAEEIFTVFEKTIVEYEEEIDRQRRLLDVVWKPEVKLHRIEPYQQHVYKEEVVLPDQQLCEQEQNTNLNQEEPEPTQIKEEEKQLCTSQEGEELELKQETDKVMSPLYEESEQSEPEPISNHQLLSHSSAVAENQDQEGLKHVDSRPELTRNTEKRCHENTSHCDSVDDSPMSEPGQFVCSVYGKTLKSHLKYHPQIHTGEKPHICDTCGKRFSHLSHLKSHLRIHTGEKPYPCITCGKAFRTSGSLTIHVRRAHTGEKPYLCNTCGKRFTEKNELVKHVRVHTGERPYTCNICGKKFKQISALNNHLKVHTSENPYLCSTYRKRFSHQEQLGISMI